MVALDADRSVRDTHYLLADIARTITLVPGDVLLSGTPADCRPVRQGAVGAQPMRSQEVISRAFGDDGEFRGIRAPRADLHEAIPASFQGGLHESRRR